MHYEEGSDHPVGLLMGPGGYEHTRGEGVFVCVCVCVCEKEREREVQEGLIMCYSVMPS